MCARVRSVCAPVYIRARARVRVWVNAGAGVSYAGGYNAREGGTDNSIQAKAAERSQGLRAVSYFLFSRLSA